MKYLLNHEQMQACDRETIGRMGVPSLVLMERAALAVYDVIRSEYPLCSRVLVLCSSGNNGGDGFALARLLLIAGVHADVLFLGKHSSMTEQTRTEAEIFSNYGGSILPDDASLKGYDLIADALFGIGLSRDIIGRYADLIRAVNLMDVPVVAVDIPSGVSADDGQIRGTAVKADCTVTFAFPKLGHILYPGARYCGKLIVRDVGITDIGIGPDEMPAYTLEKSDLPALLPRRRADANKGSYGKLLIIAGRDNMAGAALMAGHAAYRTGCGLVCVSSHEMNRTVIQSCLPEALFVPWGEDLDKWLSWADAVAIGPGLGQTPQSLALLRLVLEKYTGPLVLDADALNLLSLTPELMAHVGRNCVLTPHPGEMCRLMNASSEQEITIPSLALHPLDAAEEYSREHDCILVLKGARSIVTDGSESMINSFGNDGMATGGSGDSLTGICASLLAQGLVPFDAAKVAVCLHALAGDAAAEELGRRSMLAGDLPDYLSRVFCELEEKD